MEISSVTGETTPKVHSKEGYSWYKEKEHGRRRMPHIS